MPKIKNWSKVGKDKWKNDSTGLVISIEYDGQHYSLVEGTGTSKMEMRIDGEKPWFKNKKDARETAIYWMKKNPMENENKKKKEKKVIYYEYLFMTNPKEIELTLDEAFKRYYSKRKALKQYSPIVRYSSFIGIKTQDGEWIINNQEDLP